MKNDTIYIVQTYGDCEGKSIRTLGYCTGETADIREYFADQLVYDWIDIRPLEVTHITAEMSGRRKRLLQEKSELESKLAAIKRLI